MLHGQIIVWLIGCSAVAYRFFVSYSHSWMFCLVLGLCIQLVGVMSCALERKLNKTWLTLVVLPLIVSGFMFMEARNWISSHIFDDIQIWIVSILSINMMYFLTIIQIMREILISKRRCN